MRCRRGGGDTLNTCLSVYCSLGTKEDTSEIKLIQHVHVRFFCHISSSHESLTSQVEFCERVSGRRAHCGQQVDGVVSEAIAVGEVQFC